MILLVGAGPMAQEYAKVLTSMNKGFIVVGRSEESAEFFYKSVGIRPQIGGIEKLCEPEVLNSISEAIVTTGIEQLSDTTKALITKGIKRILVEKPAGLDYEEINSLNDMCNNNNVEVYVAYNRRFYSSVDKALEIINEDGGVKSFNFELTEWSHVIDSIKKADGVKENWFLGNTSHVTDLAFYLGGMPKEISCYSSGSTRWHSRSSNFSGAGISNNGALFSYIGNWNAPGRWSVEVLTSKRRLILRPMEQIFVQKLGSVAIDKLEINDRLDKEFKPGLYNQTKAFISKVDISKLCTLSKHCENSKIYSLIAGYAK